MQNIRLFLPLNFSEPWPFAMNIEPRYSNLTTSSKGSPPNWRCNKCPNRNGLTLLTNTGKANAFVEQYATVNWLTLNKAEYTQARHLKKALQLSTATETFYSFFTTRERGVAINAIRSKG